MNNQRRRPSGIFETNITPMTVWICGKPINLSAIGRVCGTGLPYLSYIFSGHKEASIQMYRKIAAALGITVQELLDGIEVRAQQLKDKKLRDAQKNREQYENRINQENRVAERAIAQGKPAIPCTPGLRLPEDALK